MAEEEDVRLEVEAVKAVYGDDCYVIEDFPPHVTVHFRPRTADVSSQQFVEAVLAIKSEAQYPEKPPFIYIIEAKGLDEKRQAHLVNSLQNKALELSSCLMLVSLCEEAAEVLSEMNHPEGHCPLCLYPLVSDDISDSLTPFMKLMSCYHCFHSECIIRWWNWLQEQNKIDGETVDVSIRNHRGTHVGINQHKGNCPVCRKEFDAKDIEHVINYIGTSSPELSSAETEEMDEDVKAFLQSDSENTRRQNFEALLRLQQEISSQTEPKKDLSESATPPPVTSTSETNPVGDSNRATTSKHRNSNARRNNRTHGPKRQPHQQNGRKQWIKKERDSCEQ